MKMVLRKLEVVDLATVEKLVIDNIDLIEPGMTVIDSRLLLGHSTIDLVAQDGAGSLVLMALGLKADEGMLLRVVDAYSWCLEYSDSVRRHYPTLEMSEDRPPRIMFLIERAPESFHRKIKQLNFPAIDLIEFRHIDVDGEPAAYFEPIARIRRAALGADTSAEVTPIVRPVPAWTAVNGTRSNGHAAITPRRLETPVVVAAPVAVAAPVIATAPVAAAVPVAVAAPAPAPVVEPVTIAAPAPLRAVAPIAKSSPLPPEITLVGPVTDVAPAPVRAEPNAPLRSLISQAVALQTAVVSPATSAEPEIESGDDEPSAVAGSAVCLPDEATTAEAMEESDGGVAVMVEDEASAAPAEEQPAADPSQKYLFAEAVKATDIAREFGIQIPKDGTLTRQWVDFLNQLAAK